MNTSSKLEAIRLVVIDDHPVIFLGIQLAVKRLKAHTIEIVGQYTNGTDVIADMANINCDVLLVDMRLPDIMGHELVKKILEVYPKMKIGIYSNMLDKEHILNAFKYGVIGYLPKTASYDEIVDFILSVNRGEKYVKGVVADILLENHLIEKKQEKLNITRRESEILQLVLKGHKNREIADKLNIAERTVEFHKQNIYSKLEVTNSIDLYKIARHLNLMVEKSSN